MNEIHEMMRDFRSDQPGPAAGAATQIAAHAIGGKGGRARWRRMRVLAPAVGGAAFVAAALALAFGLADGGGSSNALASVSKALSPSDAVLHYVYRVNSETRTGSGAFAVDEVVHMHEFLAFEQGHATKARLFISSGPLNRPPTDEDSVIAANAAGEFVSRSWVGGHVRTNPDTITTLDGVSTVSLLGAAIKGGQLRVVSSDGSTIRLEGVPQTTSDNECATAWGEVVVDATTFRPVSMVENLGCNAGGSTTVTSRQVITVEQSETLPDTPANRKLLEMGDWPTGDNVPLG